ncbi:MAG TPA: hypothetical protein IAC28_01195 [Candidatus Aphodovivens excrementavium]|nr:hypothetical protein [Candidatus Aphodovivens excrementavium]
MWLSFVGAVLACLIVLYLPGYLLARAFPFSRFASVALAPAFSLFVLTVLGVAAFEIANPCSPSVLLAALLVICAIPFAVRCGIARSKRGSASHSVRELAVVPYDASLWKIAALYIAVAAVLSALVFCWSMGDPTSFSRNDDTTVHLSLARGFLDSGTLSVLHTSSFLDQGVFGNFYPAEWHVLVAAVASFFGNDVSMATNATVMAFTSVVFPLAICLFMWRVFGEKREFVIGGALVSVAFVGFPWGYVVFGQLLPNMISFMMVPLALVLVIELFGARYASSKASVHGGYRASERAKLAVALVVCLGAIVLAQPNGAFTFGIGAVLYGITRIFYQPGENRASVSAKHVVLAIVVFAVACGVWFALYKAPFMQGVVTSNWEATLSPLEAVVSGLAFMFTVRQGVQPFLSIVVLVGVIYTLKHRRHLWITVAYAASLALYIISVSTDGALKQLLTGFWYTDYNRLGAMTALFAIPLAGVGVACCVGWLQKLLHVRAAKPLAAGVVVVLFALCQFLPVSVGYGDNQIRLGLTGIQHQVHQRYSWDNVLTKEENDFVKEVMEIVPEGETVINMPQDGSCWTYGVDGINTMYRRMAGSGGRPSSQSKDAALVRTKLNEVATNSEVQQVLEKYNARYLMLLDDATSANPTKGNLRYKASDWVGIESVDENTPGFELVLSEDDMRLYRITW